MQCVSALENGHKTSSETGEMGGHWETDTREEWRGVVSRGL